MDALVPAVQTLVILTFVGFMESTVNQYFGRTEVIQYSKKKTVMIHRKLVGASRQPK